MRYIIRENRGLTLIEVVIASTILMMTLIPMYNVFNWSINGIQNAGERSQLIAIAKGIMEENLAQGTYIVENYTSAGSIADDKFPLINYEFDVSFFKGNEFLKIISVTVQIEDEIDTIMQISTIRDIRR